MKTAIAQINPIIGDFEYNFRIIKKFCEKAKNENCDIVVFPELAISGYPPKDLLERSSFVDDNLNILNKLINSIKGIGVICGYVEKSERKNDQLFNAAIFFKNKKIIHKAYKRLIPIYDVFDEKRYFKEGNNYEVVAYKNHKIGITICEDLWNDKTIVAREYSAPDPATKLVENGADTIINISASPFYAGKNRIREKLIGGIAKKHNVNIIYANQTGGNDSLLFDGLSCVYDSLGRIRAIAPEFEENLLIYDLNAEKERIEKVQKYPSETESVLKGLVTGTKDYILKCGFSKAVIGLSGGIDSALTAAVAQKALGAENVSAIFMPSLYTSRENYEDTKKLAENLGIKFYTIPITSLYEEFINISKFSLNKENPSITEQNIQARIRGVILMSFSNKNGAMLLNTGNKSELAVGYCTLYGDMCGGLAVLADVFKTKVYEISNFINKDKEIIPYRIIQKAPSAELAPNQKDQDDLPEYNVLDAVLKGYIEDFKSIDEIVKEGFDESLVKNIVNRLIKSEHKRQQAPPCLKVSAKAFGYGRRYPIACKHADVKIPNDLTVDTLIKSEQGKELHKVSTVDELFKELEH
jgi:NAD+ synthase (glutamine-hydrolysing)